jgi:hypothetical protein
VPGRRAKGGLLAQGTLARRLAGSLLYAGWLLATCLGAVYLLFWLPFVRELREPVPGRAASEPPRHVDALTLRRVGSLYPMKRSSFVRFEAEKAPGGVRVCAFGDSFTYGDELGDVLDYPSRLQDLLREAGAGNVEAINFGNSWHGFHQAFLLWESLGLRFGCDFVLLGPAGFQTDRDTAFNHTDLRQPYYLHARYVLDGEGVRLVEVIGESPAERFAGYFRFLPRWQYLRYDRNPPPVLRSVLPAGRSLPNPFYYRLGRARQEVLALAAVLLGRMADSGAQIVLRHVEDDVVAMARALGRPNLRAGRALRRFEFPYRAPVGHDSGFGNDLTARQFLADLVEGAPGEAPVLETRDLPAARDGAPGPAANPPARRPLSSWERVEVRLAGAEAGHFVVASADPARRGQGSPGLLREAGVVSLLALGAPGASLLDAAFVPLDFELHDGSELRLRLEGGGGDGERVLGRVRVLDERLNLGTVPGAGLRFGLRWQDTLLLGSEAGDDALRRAGRVQLLVDGRAILEGVHRGGELALRPPRGDLLRLRAGESDFAPLAALPREGEVSLLLEGGEAGPLQVPIARFRQSRLALEAIDGAGGVRLAIREGQGRLSAPSGGPQAPAELREAARGGGS